LICEPARTGANGLSDAMISRDCLTHRALLDHQVTTQQEPANRELQGKTVKNNNRKLLSIHAFYKTNRPEGIGVCMDINTLDVNRVMKDISASSEAIWLDAQQNNTMPQLVNYLRSQLKKFGKNKAFTMSVAMMAITYIHILEKYGGLKSDNHNGLLLCYDSGDQKPNSENKVPLSSMVLH
jgi:hypothetical protein